MRQRLGLLMADEPETHYQWVREGCPETDVGCFVEGTVVWTDHGLVPIEQLKPGDMVLSQPEGTGAQQYKRVLNTFEHADKEIWHLSYYDPRREDMGYLYATANHPFWVQDVGWVALEDLEPGQNMELSDGTVAVAYKCDVLYRTAEPNIGFVTTSFADKYFGFLVDLEHGFNCLSSDGDDLLHHLQHDAPEMHRRVFNIEVEDFHTYYVGEGGLWVHNSNYSGARLPF
ncbi:polymorphic toxin-type HINT domain-containing protein [Dyella tabacisoli]|uniref:Uncharacterized protein n=1 Tax=Dyella tabacisoli TaxID=2282381 RepID=A0A369UPE9_9GAMM|nr:polymorphic toxin-type HINT domain-containing protein [Dyella tabacisoli]RDD82411.1 hypothetical protein DVJ77_07105 [Dyella tabacisoli]